GCAGIGYGGQNSYGHNDAWLSPAGDYNQGGAPAPVRLAAIPRTANTIAICDATYYGVVPDVTGASGVAVQNLRSSTNKCGTNDSTGTGSVVANDCSDLGYIQSQSGTNTNQYQSYWKNIGGASYLWAYNSSGFQDTVGAANPAILNAGGFNTMV